MPANLTIEILVETEKAIEGYAYWKGAVSRKKQEEII
jgi:hypothetical protein